MVHWEKPQRRIPANSFEKALCNVDFPCFNQAMKPKRIAPNLIVFDFDGVLTDNRVLVFDDGREAVLCNRADGLAFDLFRREGIPVLILSTEKHQVVAARAKKLKVPCLQGVADKKSALEKYCAKAGIELNAVMYVGNDVNDLAAMRTAGHRVCPSDAHPAVRSMCQIILRHRGGEGVAREVAEKVLGLQFQDIAGERA